ncbi:MAG: hypothetical protein FJZ90_05860, partial [Chloroflexi bacterium]|nr:hypothetical protein [Chloroflexota bacterium]
MAPKAHEELRKLPSIDRLLQHDRAIELSALFGRDLALEALRRATLSARAEILAGGACPSEEV